MKSIIIKQNRILVFFLSFSLMVNITSAKKSILVFSKTQAYRHHSIKEGKAFFLKLGEENKIQVEISESSEAFTDTNLRRYVCIVFLNTSGDILDNSQKAAFQKYIRNGGSFLGIHAASDTEKNWPWYNGLVGAFFQDHPKPQNARFNILDAKFPATKFIGADTINRFEEIYNFHSFQKEQLKVILTVDETSYNGGRMGIFHPFTWYHKFDGGRAFFTAFGHHRETFSDPFFKQLIIGALKWLI